MNGKYQKVPRRVWSLLLVLAALIVPSAVAGGQSVVVQLLNGKNRKPLKGYRVYILLGDPRAQHRLDLKTDRDGKVRFDTRSEETFQVITVGTIACARPATSPPNISFSVAEVIAHGIVTPNDCGSFNPEPLKSQVTFLTGSASAMDLFQN